MRWIFIGIALGVGFMLAPHLVHAVIEVVSLLFWLSAGGVYSLVMGIKNDTISVWWIAAPTAVAAGMTFLAICCQEPRG